MLHGHRLIKRWVPGCGHDHSQDNDGGARACATGSVVVLPAHSHLLAGDRVHQAVLHPTTVGEPTRDELRPGNSQATGHGPRQCAPRGLLGVLRTGRLVISGDVAPCPLDELLGDEGGDGTDGAGVDLPSDFFGLHDHDSNGRSTWDVAPAEKPVLPGSALRIAVTCLLWAAPVPCR